MHALQAKPLATPFCSKTCYVLQTIPLVSPRSSRGWTCTVAAACSSTAQATVDVAVIGSGIIGLCVARKLLQDTDLSVALLDAKQPCAGATGAGEVSNSRQQLSPPGSHWPARQHHTSAVRQVARHRQFRLSK
ncbi:hypothetical protein COO60DRAFT_864420 [Scenedesmus sp. NREL 46B-D3]|nr:hypothetical protein COO60DRAFT_864420 [Scenedesmus sp. NREL 46B-D3]